MTNTGDRIVDEFLSESIELIEDHKYFYARESFRFFLLSILRRITEYLKTIFFFTTCTLLVGFLFFGDTVLFELFGQEGLDLHNIISKITFALIAVFTFLYLGLLVVVSFGGGVSPFFNLKKERIRLANIEARELAHSVAVIEEVLHRHGLIKRDVK